MSAGAPSQRVPLWLRWWMADVLILAVCALALALAFLLTPGSEQVAVFGWSIPEVCAIKRFTGQPCPGCGMTRSWVYLAHGDWRSAFTMIVFGPVLFLTAAVQIPLRGYRIWRRSRARARAGQDAEGDSCPA